MLLRSRGRRPEGRSNGVIGATASGRTRASSSKPRRAIHSSSPATRATRYHEKCFTPWQPPASGKGRGKARRSASPRTTYPLCLVCDRDLNSTDQGSLDRLMTRFNDSIRRLEDMSQDVERQTRKQKALVLHDLWLMTNPGEPDTAGRKDSSWHEVLLSSAQPRAPSGHDDLDLVPEREWSTSTASSRKAAAAPDGHSQKASSSKSKSQSRGSEPHGLNVNLAVERPDDKSVHKCPVGQKLERSATSGKAPDDQDTQASVSLTDEKSWPDGAKAKGHRAKDVDADAFVELIIDDLKREKRELQLALVARDQQLEAAAAKVRQLSEERVLSNARLQRYRQKCLSLRQQRTDEEKSYDVHLSKLEAQLQSAEGKWQLQQDAGLLQLSDVQAAIRDLQSRLHQSESINQSLRGYIQHLKKSYQSVFGAHYSSPSPTPPSASLSWRQQRVPDQDK